MNLYDRRDAGQRVACSSDPVAWIRKRLVILPWGAGRARAGEAERALEREEEEVATAKERVVEVRQMFYETVHQALPVSSQRLLRESLGVPRSPTRLKASATHTRMNVEQRDETTRVGSVEGRGPTCAGRRPTCAVRSRSGVQAAPELIAAGSNVAAHPRKGTTKRCAAAGSVVRRPGTDARARSLASSCTSAQFWALWYQ